MNTQSKKYTTIIFDFDGTLGNSMNLIFKIYNLLSVKHHLKKISGSQVAKFRDRTPKQILSYLAIPYFKIPFLFFEGRGMFHDRLAEVELFPGILPVLKKLSKHYTLGILTSNSKKNIEGFLKQNELNLFEFIHSEFNIFGKDKALKKIMNARNLNKDEVLYIGDEVRDIESCKKIDVDIVSVAWGLNTKEVLSKYYPEYLISKPEELLNVIKT
jgi:phosphoglycolate phosphatase